MSERWAAIKTLFDRAADLDEAGRTAVLDDPLLDPLTRAEVAALLTAHDTQTMLGEGSGHDAPERVGPYVLREMLGSGGFGSVYRAEQQSPVVREAAVKLLHPTHTGRAVLSRFSLEQHALAQLDHPSIARLFEAGITADGRPWFAMQLVRGERIDRWAADAKPTLQVVVSLVAQAAFAVHHAHQRGIIHRDIKPSNILIEEIEGAPVARLIDFGVAKALKDDGGGGGLTVERVQVGTPAFMSPEQHAGSAADVRSDVYSLGAVLFDLLSRDTLEGNIASRTRGALRLNSGLGRVEERTAAVLGEILRAALAPAINDRYPSAEAFAKDLTAMLAGEPVSVCLPSIRQMVRRSMKRNPRVWIGGAASLVALVGVAGGASYGLLEAMRERDFARLAEAEAVHHRDTADATLRVAGEILTGIDPDIALGRDVSLLVERAKHTLSELDRGVLRGRPEAEALLRAVVGQALLRLGQSEEALEVFESGRAASTAALGTPHPATRDLTNGVILSLLDQGNIAKAVEEANGAIASAQRTASPAAPAASSTQRVAEMQVWATTFLAAGDIDRADKWNHCSIELVRAEDPDNLEAASHGLAMSARIASFRGDPELAVKEGSAVLESLLKRHSGDHPALMRAHNNLGAYMEEAGRNEEALEHKLASLKMARVLFPPNDARTAGALNNVSVTLQGLGRRKEAGEALGESLTMYKALHPGDHPDVARAMGHCAVWNAVDGRYTEAETFARESLAMNQRLFAGPGRNPVAHARLTLAQVVAASGRLDEAEPIFKRAVAEQRLVAKDKDSPDTARALHIYGDALLSGGRAVDATEPLREAVEIGSRLWPDASSPRPHLSEWAATLADALSMTGRSEEAERIRGLFTELSPR